MISMASVDVSNCNVKHHNMLYDGWSIHSFSFKPQTRACLCWLKEINSGSANFLLAANYIRLNLLIRLDDRRGQSSKLLRINR